MGQFERDIQLAQKGKVITAWSCDGGMGVNTFLTSAAIESARRGIRTALVELDIFHPAASITLGMSHPTRNLESWISHSQESKKLNELSKYLLNSKIWLTDHENNNSNFVKVVSELPEQLYTFAASRFIDRFNVSGLRLKPEMVTYIIKSLQELDFEVIYINIPSEMLMPVTVPSIQAADTFLVLLDGQVGHAYYTSQELKRIEHDLKPGSIKMIFNRVPTPLVKPVEKLVGRTADFILPEDSSMLERSLDLIPTGGESYEATVRAFCEDQGLLLKKGLFQDKKGKMVDAESTRRKFFGIKRKA